MYDFNNGKVFSSVICCCNGILQTASFIRNSGTYIWLLTLETGMFLSMRSETAAALQHGRGYHVTRQRRHTNLGLSGPTSHR